MRDAKSRKNARNSARIRQPPSVGRGQRLRRDDSYPPRRSDEAVIMQAERGDSVRRRELPPRENRLHDLEIRTRLFAEPKRRAGSLPLRRCSIAPKLPWRRCRPTADTGSPWTCVKERCILIRVRRRLDAAERKLNARLAHSTGDAIHQERRRPHCLSDRWEWPSRSGGRPGLHFPR